MFLKKFLLTGMAVLLSVSFILTGCPTDSEEPDDGDNGSKSDNTAITDVSTTAPITVAENDDGLVVEATGGSLVTDGLKVYVKNGTFNEVVITEEDSLSGYTKVTSASVSVASPEITVTGLTPATTNGAAGVLKAATVTVTLAADAQTAQVTSIAAESSNPAKVLETALGGKATADGTTVTLTANVEIGTGGLLLPEGVTLVVPATGGGGGGTGPFTLTVSTGSTLSVAGTLSVAATGVIDVENGGEFTLSANGANAGTITIKSGGESRSTASLEGNGKTVVQSGGEAYFGERFFIGGSGSVANFALAADSTLSFNNTTFELDGEVTLNGLLDVNSATVGAGQKSWLINADNQTLTINPGSVFTVAANAWLILRNDNTAYPVVGGTGGGAAPQIVFQANSKVQPDGGGTPYVGKANFYNAGGAEIFTGWQYAANTETTFNWDATLGDGGGWQEDFDVIEDAYALADADGGVNTNGNTTNLTRVARRSKADGTVYIRVSMKDDTTSIPGVSDFTVENGLWGAIGTGDVPSGEVWSDMAIDLGAVLYENANKVLAIRSTSHSYCYYAGGDTLTENPQYPVKEGANIYLPADPLGLPVKWGVYAANTFTEAKAVTGIILRKGAPSKIITLEITERNGFTGNSTDAGEIATIVIDYNGVTIQDPVAQ